MKTVLYEAVVVTGSISLDEVARLIRRPACEVRRLMLGEREFAVSEIVVIASALGADWRLLVLDACNGATH
ncbi:hypothetical protein LRM64_19535 [Prescottella equi]|uniref:hypothetical protein n=1 Tax=Rhodococcus hoagii TaxID=43767 RepID=UPI0019DB3FBB|nr:hypothetical protein [Prescottella equi]MBM4580872.1 hypothetical protein [Prescottella equi]MBM4580887.1 hypothetical protein [Prescottella equi]MBM4580949.1 hypothetical protein [Prescottella equi]MBM4581432.1 hypothetical protein [Prescottella equi]MBM4581436.1 hypothetical protein [Prescottella equi]